MMDLSSDVRRYFRLLVLISLLLLFVPFAFLGALETVVIDWNPAERTAVVNAGRKDGVEPGDRFNIFAAEKVILLPFSGGRKLMEVLQPIAILTVTEVTLSTASGSVDLVKEELAPLIRKGCIARKIETKENVNRPPSLSQLTFSADEVCPGSSVRVTLDWNDPNGDTPVFHWGAQGAYVHFPVTHFPWNIIHIPLNFREDKLVVTVTADDRKENGRASLSFEKTVSHKSYDVYLNSQYQETRTFHERFTGDRFSADDVEVLPDGGIVVLAVSRRSLFFFDALMNLRFAKEVESPIALAASGSVLYLLQTGKYTVLDSDGEKVREVFFDDSKLNSYIREPVALGVKANGDVMVIDGYTKQVKVFSAEGNYRLSFGVAGQNPGGFLQPIAVVEDRFGNMLVLDSQRGDIQVFTPRYEVKDTPISVSSLPGPVDMAYDPVLHTIYVLGSGGRILEIDGSDASKRKFYEPESGTFTRFCRTPAGVFYIASTVDRTPVLQRYIPGEGAAWYADSNFVSIEDVACDAAGNMYLLCPDSRDAMIRVLDRDGWYFASMVPREADPYGHIRYPISLEVSPDGRLLYVLDEDKRVLEFSSDGTFRAAYEVKDACSIAVDGRGVLHVLSGREGKVFRGESGSLRLICSVQDSRTAKRCALLEVSKRNADIFIANTRNYKIFLFSSGNFMQPFPPGKSNFKRFRSLASNSMDMLFVLDDRQVVTPLYRGNVGLLAGTEIAARGCTAVAADACGKLVLLDKRGLRVLLPAFLANE